MMRRNILANYLGTMVSIVAPVIALPFYVQLLGPKQFGLIGFITTIQTFLGLLESGMSQVAIREFSIRMGDGLRSSAAVLLSGFERVYWVFAIGAGCVTLLSAGYISSHWLVLDTDLKNTGYLAVVGAAVLFMIQFPGALYRSFLSGAQEQVHLNRILVTGTLLRHAGGVGILTFFPHLEAYLIWLILIGVLDTLIRAISSWKAVGVKRSTVGWNAAELKPVWPVVLKLSSAVLLGALTGQLDRIILSRMVPIDQFGYYVIASTLATGALHSIYPLVQAFSPKLMQANEDPVQLRSLSFRLFKLIIAIVGVVAVGYVMIGEQVLVLWLNNVDTAKAAQGFLTFLLIGSAMNALYHVGYYNWLARGRTDRIFMVNGLSFAVAIVGLPMFISTYGAIGATFGFVMMNIVGLCFSVEWVKK